MAMLYFLLLLGVFVNSEEIKHNLPEGLEIVDPKSLGLKTDDLDKILGNVKLLPIASGNVGDTKTQILTVGFDGDEKLNLEDFELPTNFNLPAKDQEIAQVAFKQFQDYIQNNGNDNTTPATISETTQVSELQPNQKQQLNHRNSEENRSRQQQQQLRQNNQIQQNQQNQQQQQQAVTQQNQPRNSVENFQHSTQSFININQNPQINSQEQFNSQIHQQNQPNQNQQQAVNFQLNHQQHQQQQLPQPQLIFPNQINFHPQQQVHNQQQAIHHHQRPQQHMMAFHTNPNQQINYQVINHAQTPIPATSHENYQHLNYQNSPPQIKHRSEHQKPYQIFPPKHQHNNNEIGSKISQSKLIPAFESTSTEIFGARLKNRNIETFSGNFNPPKEVVRNFIPNIVTTQRSIVEVTPSMPMIPLSTNENAIRNFSRVNHYQNYHRSQEQFSEYNQNQNKHQNRNNNHDYNSNENNLRNYNLNQSNNFIKNFQPNNIQQQNFQHNPNLNQNRFTHPQIQAKPPQNAQNVLFTSATTQQHVVVPPQHHQPIQRPSKVRNFENVGQQSVAYAQVHPFSAFNQNPSAAQQNQSPSAVHQNQNPSVVHQNQDPSALRPNQYPSAIRQNAFGQNANPSSSSESAFPSKIAAIKPQQAQAHAQYSSQHQQQHQQQHQAQPLRNRRQNYGNKLISRFRRLFHF